MIINPLISEYITGLFVSQDETLQNIPADSARQGLPEINIRPEEGRFLQFLVRACGARKVVEIGTLGGYSGTWLARGLPQDGRLITLEMELHHAAVAQEHFTAAGVAERIEIRLGDAHQTLPGLAAEGPFDFVFIDAEKSGYQAYFEWAVENVRPGGVIAAHNAFRKGSVMGLKEPDAYTEIAKAFNRQVAADPRVLATIYPGGDGTLIAVRL